MIDPKEREVLDKATKINRMIWTAMLLSIGVYILVAHLPVLPERRFRDAVPFRSPWRIRNDRLPSEEG